MVGDDDVGLCALLHDDEHTAVYHGVLLALEHVVYLNGVLGTGVARHMDEQRVHGKHGVQCHNGITVVCYIIVVGCKVDVCLLDGTAELRTLGGDGRQLYAIVGSKVLRHVGILVSFYLPGGEPLLGEDAQGLFPVGVHHGA